MTEMFPGELINTGIFTIKSSRQKPAWEHPEELCPRVFISKESSPEGCLSWQDSTGRFLFLLGQKQSIGPSVGCKESVWKWTCSEPRNQGRLRFQARKSPRQLIRGQWGTGDEQRRYGGTGIDGRSSTGFRDTFLSPTCSAQFSCRQDWNCAV